MRVYVGDEDAELEQEVYIDMFQCIRPAGRASKARIEALLTEARPSSALASICQPPRCGFPVALPQAALPCR